ncbi:hypothetical protein QTP70_022854 [Hemibagrus guttatus]|uniref:Gypsy retrotransposon integrase-like protein 1 n=1 Tax=Hemibagrus guttatus TaxID=175788 RepID=A0AAE0QZG7_9TELE|nr:hypothetical protein QTP70_022854 [Hemibagrus guttatus]
MKKNCLPCLLFKHYILAFGGILAIPLILAEPLCIKDNNAAKSQLVSTIFFVSGICTMLQTTIGTRLPILQGGTFTFITPALAILALPKWQCPKEGITPDLNATLASVSHIDPEELWKMRMREIQGAILVASLLQVVLGLSGLVGFVLKFIGPLAIAPTINLIGLSLFIQAGKKSGAHWGISALTVFLILLFSQYLNKVRVPLIAYKDKKWKVFHYPLFSLFSALFGMSGAWLVCFLLTYFNVLPTSPHEYGYQARTDINLDAVSSAEWFFMPYPGQWGLPTVSISSVLGMMAGVLASTMESIGDYYACARLSGAPNPPTHAINRGIAVEGLGCILAGLWGSGNGTTSYSQNIAALGITKVGSRLVLQTSGLLMVVLGLFGKFSAMFITIPEPVIGGMFLVMFGMVAAVGISNLQYVDLNSSRNLLIFGISIFTGLVLPTWFDSNPNTINTSRLCSANGSEHFRLRRSPVTEYFAYHGSSGASRHHRVYQDQVEALQNQLRSASIAAPRDPPTARGESPRLALPKFDGSADRCRGFLRQCKVFFAQQPGMYSNEETQCAFVMSLLMSRALEWASAVWEAGPQIRSSFSYFAGLILEVFEYPAGGKDISPQLMELCQGSDTAVDYAITFRTLAAQSGWNDASLWAVFRAGLNSEPQTELARHAEATTLSQFVATAIRLDNLRRQHQAGASRAATARPRTRYPSFREEAPKPMQLGRSRLADINRLRSGRESYHQERLAFYVTSSTANPVILGFPWLWRHDPQISWRSGELVTFRRLTRSSGRSSARRGRPDCPHINPGIGGRVYPLSLPESKAMEEYIETALAVGHIWPSTSPAAAGFFFVALEQLRGARMFTKLDLRSAYNLVRIRKGDEWKTAFHTTHATSPLREVGKVQVPPDYGDFLGLRDLTTGRGDGHGQGSGGHRLARSHYSAGVAAVPGFRELLQAVHTELSSVMGLLTSLLRGKPKRLVWTDQAREAFQQLKECFTSAPILRHPDPDLPFVVEVDASSSGLGAVLSQCHGKPGKLRPCAYYSRKLTAAKANYDVGNRELLAIKAALEEWRHWLEGARHPFQVLTDHRNLEYLRGTKRLNPRQARWALFFTRFQFTVTYRPGSKNGKADALSRGFETASEPTLVEPILPATAILAPVRWNFVEEIQHSHADEPPPAGCPLNRIFVPSQFHLQVMQWIHEAPSSGHPGIQRSTQLVCRRFWWPSLVSDVEGHMRACSTCAQARTSCQLPEGLLEPLLIPRRPWFHLSVDFLTDLPDSGGHTTVLVVVDRFSKGCKLMPLKGLPSAMQTAEALFLHMFRNFGLPEDIVSDWGSQFTSRVWGSLCARLGIGVSLSSGYHPQSNGQAERLNQEISWFLRSYCSREQHRWSEFLPWAEYAQNSLIHSSMGLTPFQCALGYQPPLFPWSGEPSNVPAVEEWYQRSQEVWERAHVRLQRAVRRQRIQADRRRRLHPSYRVGQKVWLSTQNIHLKLPCHKLSPRFISPFEIICQVNPVAYRLRLPATYRICPTFHVSLLKPAHPLTEGAPASGEPPPPLDVEGSSAYRLGEWIRTLPSPAEPRHSVTELDQLITVLFTTPMFIGGFLGFILDNTIPGTDEERGIKRWRDKGIRDGRTSEIFSNQSCYDLPFCTNFLHKFRFLQNLPFLPSIKSLDPLGTRL